jgi:hypothetical protein
MVPHRFMYEEEEEDDDERTKIPGTNEMENIYYQLNNQQQPEASNLHQPPTTHQSLPLHPSPPITTHHFFFRGSASCFQYQLYAKPHEF